MKKLLKFVDDYVYESQMYFRLGQIYNSSGEAPQWEIQWQARANKSWRMKKVESSRWIDVATNDLIEQLSVHKIDLDAFEVALKTNLLQCAAYADSFLQESRRLLGDQVIEAAIMTNHNFLLELQSTVEQLIKDGVVKPEQSKLPLRTKPALNLVQPPVPMNHP